MPVNYQQIKSQIKTWGESAPRREEQLGRLRVECRELLQGLQDPAALAEKIQAAARRNPHLRTAAPAGEAPSGRFPLPELHDRPVVLAADGSQINPDHHAAVEFCVINAGAFYMQAGGPAQDATEVGANRRQAGEAAPGPSQAGRNDGQGGLLAPCERVESILLAADALYNENGLITEEVVALRRDLKEREFIARLAGALPPPVVTLTDGPLELYMERESNATRDFRELFQEYLQVLKEIAGMGVVTAGYVDKPHADLLVRMLEISRLSSAELDQAGRTRPYRGVLDSDLFYGQLEPGERTAVFAIISPSGRNFDGPLALHFFYLNAGRPGSPWITRVEIPAWVAGDTSALDRLHAVLIQQCRMLGGAPYPYVLQRAHEVAVVRMPEREMIESMLQAELIQRGLPFGVQSYKQHHKSHTGRTGMHKR